jgi:5-methylcytosine-specific restriction endonuclease McrA
MAGKCEWCGSEEDITIDHIVPKWFYKRSESLGIPIKKNLGKKNHQALCRVCNEQKGGRIDLTHPVAREYLGKWVEQLYEDYTAA